MHREKTYGNVCYDRDLRTFELMKGTRTTSYDFVYEGEVWG